MCLGPLAALYTVEHTTQGQAIDQRPYNNLTRSTTCQLRMHALQGPRYYTRAISHGCTYQHSTAAGSSCNRRALRALYVHMSMPMASSHMEEAPLKIECDMFCHMAQPTGCQALAWPQQGAMRLPHSQQDDATIAQHHVSVNAIASMSVQASCYSWVTGSQCNTLLSSQAVRRFKWQDHPTVSDESKH